jgi:hypothetical protein
VAEIGMMVDSEVERSTFSHVNLMELEATKVRLLVITLMPFLLELSVRVANVLEPFTLRLDPRVSIDANVRLFSLLVQVREVEFPVVQVQVTVSPGHTDCLSHSIEVVSIVENLRIRRA